MINEFENSKYYKLDKNVNTMKLEESLKSQLKINKGTMIGLAAGLGIGYGFNLDPEFRNLSVLDKSVFLMTLPYVTAAIGSSIKEGYSLFTSPSSTGNFTAGIGLVGTEITLLSNPEYLGQMSGIGLGMSAVLGLSGYAVSHFLNKTVPKTFKRFYSV